MTNIIVTVAIPFVIELLKKVKLPSKLAPVIAIVLGVVYVVASKFITIPGVEINSIYEGIVTALGISGVSVLGYDIFHKLTEKK